MLDKRGMVLCRICSISAFWGSSSVICSACNAALDVRVVSAGGGKTADGEILGGICGVLTLIGGAGLLVLV